MKNVVKYFVSNSELDLIEDIRMIGYGELYDVTFKSGEPYGMVSVEGEFTTLLKMLKDGTRFDVIVIHDGSPVTGQLEGRTDSGLRYLQKVKF